MWISLVYSLQGRKGHFGLERSLLTLLINYKNFFTEINSKQLKRTTELFLDAKIGAIFGKRPETLSKSTNKVSDYSQKIF